MWKNILGRRDEHLNLAIKHFSLKREDVDQYVRRSLKHL
jgi:hypothetical protein